MIIVLCIPLVRIQLNNYSFCFLKCTNVFTHLPIALQYNLRVVLKRTATQTGVVLLICFFLLSRAEGAPAGTALLASNHERHLPEASWQAGRHALALRCRSVMLFCFISPREKARSAYPDAAHGSRLTYSHTKQSQRDRHVSG